MSSLFAPRLVNLAVGTTEEFTAAGLLLVLAVLVVRGVRGWEPRFTALMLLGSALCIVFEPAIDAVGGVWFATVSQHLGLPRMWGVKVGLHSSRSAWRASACCSAPPAGTPDGTSTASWARTFPGTISRTSDKKSVRLLDTRTVDDLAYVTCQVVRAA